MPAFDLSGEDQSDIDREIRIERMKRELDDLAGGPMISGAFEQISPELEEIFLTRVCEFEKAQWDTNLSRLIERGVAMTPPAELDDASLHAKLHEVIRALGTMHCFLEDTDHLSDRELYEWLWTDGLREETPDLSRLDGAWHMSPIGSCNEQDMLIFLKYYADEKERERWQQEFPSDPLPPRCPLPYDRDRNLPRLESR
jgi:hypothetical protein